MSIDTAEITAYLDRYARSLSDLAAEAAAGLRPSRGMIADEPVCGGPDSREAMAQGLEQSYPVYRKLGLASVGYDLLGEDHLTEGLVMVRVRWDFFDADGARLTDSIAHYLLRREDEGLRATVCVQTDDVEKLQALAAEKGVDLFAQEE